MKTSIFILIITWVVVSWEIYPIYDCQQGGGNIQDLIYLLKEDKVIFSIYHTDTIIVTYHIWCVNMEYSYQFLHYPITYTGRLEDALRFRKLECYNLTEWKVK